MITCPKCSKENQDHYKFCLGCGAELPRDGGGKSFSTQTPPHGVRPAASAVVAPPRPGPNATGSGRPPSPSASGEVVGSSAHMAAAQPVGAPPPVVVGPQAVPPQLTPNPALVAPVSTASGCPQCGHNNSPTNKFCAACGYNLSAAALQQTPQPPPAQVPIAPPQTTGAVPQVVLTALRADGTEAGTFQVPMPTTVLGRDIGGIFAGDSYLSPRHATLAARGGRLFVKDELSLNGVYLKLTPHSSVELRSGDVFRIGQEIIRFEGLQTQPPSPDGVERLGSPARGYIGRIALVTGRDTTGNAFPVPEHGLSIGRERGDILFPEDGYVSGLHCQISWENGKAHLTDVGSSNGTFVRLFAEHELRSQDILLMGQQLFRVVF